MKYLQSYHIKEIKKHCQLQCQHMMVNKAFEKDVKYHRGLWSGYIYGIKICNKIILGSTYYNKHTLYYHFKKKQNLYIQNRGVSQALFDIMNFISNINEQI